MLDIVTRSEGQLWLHTVSSFVHGLFNNVARSCSYMVLNRRTVGEKLIANAVEGRCHDVI